MNKPILLSIVIIIILLVSGLFLFSQNQNLKQEINVLNKKIEDLQKQELKPVVEKPPEGWKEYVDEEYKFRIWYPEEFSYDEITDQTKIQKSKDEKRNTISFYVNVILGDTSLRLLYIYIYNSNLDIKDYVLNDAEKIIKNFPLVMLQNKDPEHYITEIKSDELIFYKFEIPSEFIVRHYFKKNNNIFILNPENEDFSLYPGLKSIIDQMVHSFQFIE